MLVFLIVYDLYTALYTLHINKFFDSSVFSFCFSFSSVIFKELLTLIKIGSGSQSVIPSTVG